MEYIAIVRPHDQSTPDYVYILPEGTANAIRSLCNTQHWYQDTIELSWLPNNWLATFEQFNMHARLTSEQIDWDILENLVLVIVCNTVCGS